MSVMGTAKFYLCVALCATLALFVCIQMQAPVVVAIFVPIAILTAADVWWKRLDRRMKAEEAAKAENEASNAEGGSRALSTNVRVRRKSASKENPENVLEITVQTLRDSYSC